MLGSRIASLRWVSGLSQEDLAKRLKVSPSTVGMYEQGRRTPPNDILVALSKEFGVTVDYLITGHIHSRQDLMALSKSRTLSISDIISVAALSREDLIALITARLTNMK